MISILMTSNRPSLWKDFYDRIDSATKDTVFEIIAIGPEETDDRLPKNFKHIKTKNIKVPQCAEIALRNAQNDLVMYMGDDHVLWEKGLDDLMHEYNGSVLVPNFRDRGRTRLLTYAQLKQAPICSLNAALFDKTLLDKGIDTRFLGTYWDYDLGMRLLETGVDIVMSKNIWCVEHSIPSMPDQKSLCSECQGYDKPILNEFWYRQTKQEDTVPSAEVWCYMKSEAWVVSKKRLDSVQEFDDKNILIESQGVKEFRGNIWE